MGIQTIVEDLALVRYPNISIFPLDIGGNGNRYFLDLLAFESRGVSWIENDAKSGKIALENFIWNYKDLILLNLEVNYSNLNEGKIHPKILPNLYKGQKIEISAYRSGYHLSVDDCLSGEIWREWVWQKRRDDRILRYSVYLKNHWFFYEVEKCVGFYLNTPKCTVNWSYVFQIAKSCKEGGVKAFEIKRTRKYKKKDLNGLKLLLKDYPIAKAFFVYGGDKVLYVNGICVMPYKECIRNLSTILLA